MITAAFERDQKGSIRSFRVSGHSGYAEAGSDIICAGVSSLCYAAANALEDICGYDNEEFLVIRGDGTEDVDLSIKVPDKGTAEVRDRAQVILRMAELGIIAIAAEYNGKGKKYLEINNKKTPEV